MNTPSSVPADEIVLAFAGLHAECLLLDARSVTSDDYTHPSFGHDAQRISAWIQIADIPIAPPHTASSARRCRPKLRLGHCRMICSALARASCRCCASTRRDATRLSMLTRRARTDQRRPPTTSHGNTPWNSIRSTTRTSATRIEESQPSECDTPSPPPDEDFFASSTCSADI